MYSDWCHATFHKVHAVCIISLQTHRFFSYVKLNLEPPFTQVSIKASYWLSNPTYRASICCLLRFQGQGAVTYWPFSPAATSYGKRYWDPCTTNSSKVLHFLHVFWQFLLKLHAHPRSKNVSITNFYCQDSNITACLKCQDGNMWRVMWCNAY